MKQTRPIGFHEPTLQNTKLMTKRTPGLFKEEWAGAGIIGLSGKTYYCFGAYDKFSCKGVNKKTNDINKEIYLNVLLTKQSSAGSVSYTHLTLPTKRIV